DLPATEENIKNVLAASELALSLQPLSDGGITYLIENSLEPTIMNAYEAQYAVGTGELSTAQGYFSLDASGYYAEKAESTDLSSLSDRIDGIINEAGLPIDEDTRTDAAWLIERGIPLEPSALQSYEDLKSIEIPLDKKSLMNEMMDAISQGKSAENAYLIKDYRLIKKERILSETRLKMATEARQLLSEDGFSIDSDGLSKEVELLKLKEASYYKAAFGNGENDTDAINEKTKLAIETQNYISEIRTLPIDLIGPFSASKDFTLKDVHETGKTLQSRYEAANRSYEALGTEVRSDLGDSIKKAFANVDSILSDLNIEATEDNRRAIRILGYNQMEINPENFFRVRSADAKLKGLLDNMTPSATVALIRENINPLSLSIDELTEKVRSLKDSGDEAEKFSEYLVRLENNNDITAAEAESYLGIYRLFRQIEKSDGAVIGSLLESGRELNLKNLLTELRSRKKGGMDLKIDLDFGGVEIEKEDSLIPRIDSQIGASFAEKDFLEEAARQVYEKLDPDKLIKGRPAAESTVPELLDLLNEADGEKLPENYYREAARELQAAANAEEAVYQNLLNYSIPITADHINALSLLLSNRGSLFKGLNSLAGKDEEEDLEKSEESFLSSLDSEDPDKIRDSYEDLTNSAEEILNRSIESADKYIDLRELKLLHKQLSVARQLGTEENYEVPVNINGELTSINLKLIRDTDKAKVEISLENEPWGRVKASFSLTDRLLSGVVKSSSPEGGAFLKSRRDSFLEALKAKGIEAGQIEWATESRLDINTPSMPLEEGNGTGTEGAILYRSAKAFLESIMDA
ncbi:MAG: hypothetical protein J6O55_07070, partial [Lachnospiraceae bacterium]|nr:hypothetical protein [Lachnospiraceae bacterium]